jgi:hypothetical protein
MNIPYKPKYTFSYFHDIMASLWTATGTAQRPGKTRASRCSTAWYYEPWLAFVVAGGGFAGVETIGSINDFFRAALVDIVTLGSTAIVSFCRCSVVALADLLPIHYPSQVLG